MIDFVTSFISSTYVRYKTFHARTQTPIPVETIAPMLRPALQRLGRRFMTQTADPPTNPPDVTRDLVDEAETAALARALAACARPGDVIALAGNLGAGKTSFARAFVRAFHGDEEEEVPSPTFTLVQTYPGPRGELWHVDAYRLKDPDEILELGLDDAFPDDILLIEWPDRLGPHLPRRRLEITLSHGPTEASRRAILRDCGGCDWCQRLMRSGEAR
jgi:tRNA threonylcarbamoyladenosine biosynthesis protein TsaE